MVAGYLNYVELCRVQVPVAAVGGQELGSVGIPWELGSVGICWAVSPCSRAQAQAVGAGHEGGQPWLPQGAACLWEGGNRQVWLRMGDGACSRAGLSCRTGEI